MKDQYKEKCTALSDQLETIFKESQNYKRNLVGIEEIRADRDKRIADLRQEIEEITGKYELSEQANA